ncbi:MAG: HDOD domain-containing protein [Deltaproteobacteria bacterium]|nr:HDOD domain-containing protein [Deltaproteobacteria bacterium]
MKTNKVENIIGSVDRLPTLPIIYTKLTNLLQSPNATAKMISDVISEDQSIAVRVLNLVNSAFYSLPQKIGNLKHAIVILGLMQIRNLVLVTSTIKMFKELKSGSSFDMQKFWKHSIGCAVAARVLAETAYLKSPDDVFTGGLLHDIGKLVHAIYLKEDFAAVIDDVRESGLPVIEVEKRIFGCDHTYTGRELAIKWNLSEGTVDMIRHHHLSDNSAELTKEISAVHIGNTLCIALGLGSGGEKKVPVAQMKAWEILDIEMNNLETIIERIDRLFNESVVILES